MAENRTGKRFDRFSLVAGLVVSSLVAALYLKMFHEVVRTELTSVGTGLFYNQFTPHFLIRLCILFLLCLLVFSLLLFPGRCLLRLAH